MAATAHATGIRPFHLEVPEEQRATLQALARYWATEYDFGRLERRLNALPQFTTEIDGIDRAAFRPLR